LDSLALLLWDLEGSLLHLGLRELPGVEYKLLEIALIYQFLELSPERTTVHGMMAHTVVKSAILPGFRSLLVGQEWPRAPDKLLVLDGIVHLATEALNGAKLALSPWTLARF